MRFVFDSISRIILSILSVKQLSPVRSLACSFKSLALILALALPLFAAAPAHAQTSPGPQGAGMFECLGDYDWGCRIISFMFEDTNNEVTYIKAGKPISELPGPVEKGLRTMMGFFSNAMLIIAGVILLYHLIVMVAETAHTGTIGGKETNQLWAPIRLIIAIGLLVPLASGMNSGQYIVLQIAKWGSGLASQTWKVFATALTENETLPGPPTPRVYDLGVNLLRSYFCMEAINDTITSTTLKDKVTLDTDVGSKEGKVEKFNSQSHANICGTITHKVVQKANNDDISSKGLSLQLIKANDQTFEANRGGLQTLAQTLYQNFKDRTVTARTTDVVKDALKTFQDGFNNRTNYDLSQTEYKKITQQIKDGANSQGWTSAGAWLLAITRAQGETIIGGMTIPEASPPSLNDSISKSIRDVYGEFNTWLLTSPDMNKTLPALNTGVGNSSKPVNSDREINEYMNLLKIAGESSIDKLFRGLNWVASTVELWDSDNKKAFGDLGGSTNPFGEIASLGQKKLRLGLNYMGVALVGTVISAVAEGVSAAQPYNLPSNSAGEKFVRGTLKIGSSVLSKATAALVAVVLMIATLFLLAGVLLAFVVPMLPFTRYFFAILTWLGTLIEAMVCIPFFALAHLTPKGEGFAGPNARTGYQLIFQIFMRPVLCLFGLIASIMLFYVAAKFLNFMFYEATSGIADFAGDAMVFVQKLVFGLMYAGLIYLVANISTKMIDHIPKHALRWMGQGVQEEGYEGHSEFLGIASAIGGQSLISNFTSLPEKVGNIAGQPALVMGNMWDSRRTAKIGLDRHREHMGHMADANRIAQGGQGGGAQGGGAQGGGQQQTTTNSPQEITYYEQQLAGLQRGQAETENDIHDTQAQMAGAAPAAMPALQTQLKQQRKALKEQKKEELQLLMRLQHMKSPRV